MAGFGRLQVLFTSLPGRYARSLFASGLRSNCLDEIFDDFGKLEDLFQGGGRAKKMLTCGFLNKREFDECLKIIGETLGFCDVFSAFIRQLAINKRFKIIQNVRHIFEKALMRHKGERNVVVSSFFSLSPAQKKEMKNLASEVVKERVIMKYEIDKRILGGLKIVVDDLVIDASVLSQFRQTSAYLLKSVMNREIV